MTSYRLTTANRYVPIGCNSLPTLEQQLNVCLWWWDVSSLYIKRFGEGHDIVVFVTQIQPLDYLLCFFTKNKGLEPELSELSGNLLARIEMGIRHTPSSIAEGKDLVDVPEERYCDRYRNASLPKARLENVHFAIPKEVLTDGPRPDEIWDESSYIGCVTLHPPLQSQHAIGENGSFDAAETQNKSVSSPTKKDNAGDKRRNTRFKRFIASRQTHRAKALQSQSDNETSANQSDSAPCSLKPHGVPTLEIQHGDTEPEVLPDVIRCNSKGVPPHFVVEDSLPSTRQCNLEEMLSSTADVSPSERNMPQFSANESHTSAASSPTNQGEKLDASPSGICTPKCTSQEMPTSMGDAPPACVADASSPEIPIAQHNVNESPASAAGLPPVSLPMLCSKDDEPPAMEDPIVKNKSFEFIWVQPNRNPKGANVRERCKSSKDKQKKRLTWWDDEVNKDESFAQKIDASMGWDDESKLDLVGECNCNDQIKGILCETQNCASSTDKDEHIPYGAPNALKVSAVFSHDEAIADSSREMQTSIIDEPPAHYIGDVSSPERPITQYNPDESPTSVAELPPLSVPSYGDDGPPALGEPIDKKKPCQFIWVESYRNPKGILFRKRRKYNKNNPKKQLTWWDDEANKGKPFTLKTDASMGWDDESTLDPVGRTNCNDQIKEIFCGTRNRVLWIDEDDDIQYYAPTALAKSDAISNNEATVDLNDDDSLYHHVPIDKQTQEKVENAMEYYTGKLGNSLSQAVQSGKDWYVEDSFAMDSIDTSFDAITSMDLFNIDLFNEVSPSLPEEKNGDKSISELSVATPQQRCNSCF